MAELDLLATFYSLVKLYMSVVDLLSGIFEVLKVGLSLVKTIFEGT